MTKRPAGYSLEKIFKFIMMLTMRLGVIIFFFAAGISAAVQFVPVDKIQPPAPMREFRGAWIATVNNIDWPSKSNLSSAQQQRELREIIERAAQLKLNALIFQVRPACKAGTVGRVSYWKDGQGTKACLGSANICDPRSPSTRAGAARMVQSLSGAL